MGFEFHQRAVCNRKVVQIITHMLAPVALSYVCRNRNRSSLNLTDESICFSLWQQAGDLITFNCSEPLE